MSQTSSVKCLRLRRSSQSCPQCKEMSSVSVCLPHLAGATSEALSKLMQARSISCAARSHANVARSAFCRSGQAGARKKHAATRLQQSQGAHTAQLPLKHFVSVWKDSPGQLAAIERSPLAQHSYLSNAPQPFHQRVCRVSAPAAAAARKE